MLLLRDPLLVLLDPLVFELEKEVLLSQPLEAPVLLLLFRPLLSASIKSVSV